MARCKDCFHFDVCMDYTSLKDSDFAQNFNETDILCDHFKRAADVAAVRHGEWVFVDDVNDEDARYYCSLCQAGDVHKKEFNVPYCWMCGARMDGKGESDETL